MGYPRGVPMARGRIRAMTKFLSHIDIALGIADTSTEKAAKTSKKVATAAKKPSQKPVTAVKESPAKVSSNDSSAESSDSTVSSAS